jgi:tetratricopeptide (TPR) repeat protein
MVRQRLRVFAAAALAVTLLPVCPHAAGQIPAALPIAGVDDPYLAFVDFQLADMALERLDYATAAPLFERAVSQLDRLYGADHEYPAIARSRLAVVYQRKGQRTRSEALIQQASAIIERTIGADTRWFAQCLVVQGTLREEAGDYQKAEEIERRALALLERIGETRNVQFASLLNNLGMIAAQQNDATRAEDLFRRALALNEDLDGPDSLGVAIQYQNLGVLARERRDYASAIDLYTRAMTIRERRLGANHPDIAPLLNNLATVRYAQGDIAGSLDTHFRALRIQEQAFGVWHGATLVSVGNIARRYAASGDLVNAIIWQRRADEVIERQLALQLAVGSERQKLAFVNSIAERTERTLSLHLRETPADPDAAALAALVLLQRKGRVLDAMVDTFASMRNRGLTESDRTLLDRLDKTTAEFAQLALNAPAAGASTAAAAPTQTPAPSPIPVPAAGAAANASSMPGASTASREQQADARLRLDNGEMVTVPKTIAANARLTINIETEDDDRLHDAAVSTVITSDVPIIAERSMYWLGAAKPWGEGHNSFGVVRADTHWGLAEGRVGGPLNFHTFILLANPQSTAAQVAVTFLRENAAPIVKTYTVPATSRFNIDTSSVDGLRDESFGALITVTNGIGIIVERSMYWDQGGVPFSGGTNATGIALSEVP